MNNLESENDSKEMQCLARSVYRDTEKVFRRNRECGPRGGRSVHVCCFAVAVRGGGRGGEEEERKRDFGRRKNPCGGVSFRSYNSHRKAKLLDHAATVVIKTSRAVY